MNKRFQRRGHRKKKTKIPKGYDSLFEYDLHQKLKGCDYHTHKIEYVSKHTYQPDFVPKNEPNILLESKGRFRTSGEARKYKDIQKSNPDYEIIFIFYQPDCPMPHSKKRKDGTKQTHAEWAERNGFRHYTIDTLPKEWCR